VTDTDLSQPLLIVVVTYNSGAIVGTLLDSVPAALDGLQADVVIVDNGSTDDTASIVEARTDCRLIRAENNGYSAGINLGTRSNPDADLVLILNPDTVLEPGCVLPMVRAARRPDVGIVVPRVLWPDGRLQYSLRREPTLARTLALTRSGLAVFAEYVNRPADYDHEHQADWALGAVMLFTREVFDRLGGWDESYFLYSEETDFCLRAGDLGIKTWFVPDSAVVHVGGGSGQSAKTHSMMVVNRVRCYGRRHSDVATLLFMALVIAREVAWGLRGGSRSWVAIRALLRPSTRPAELRCSTGLLPR
jgi:N-acetylglucosaminyl-diphospho-decaprenol L-rhamnosyltransferase